MCRQVTNVNINLRDSASKEACSSSNSALSITSKLIYLHMHLRDTGVNSSDNIFG